jgi:putative iron-dependent peroxidase
MATPQDAIFRQGLRAHEHLEFDLKPRATAAEVRLAFAQLSTGISQATVAGFGARLWRLIAPEDEIPPNLSELAPMRGTGGVLPAQPHDLWLWLQDRGPDNNLDAARRAVAALAPVLQLVEDTPGFVYHDGRDLTGFIDGTENPPPAEALEVALIADGPGAAGSFALVMRWRHDLQHFHALPVAEQERVIGRTKLDSVQLPELPENSHVGRVTVETDHGELKLWRRSVPWGKATVNGLQFVAFSADPQRYTAMLERMFGVAPDGKHDRLLDFSKPENGALYFVPSLEALQRCGLP